MKFFKTRKKKFNACVMCIVIIIFFDSQKGVKHQMRGATQAQ
jgi:hypothetical protein